MNDVGVPALGIGSEAAGRPSALPHQPHGAPVRPAVRRDGTRATRVRFGRDGERVAATELWRGEPVLPAGSPTRQEGTR